MKPALEELADRNLDRLKADFNAHKEVDEYHEITSFLDRRHQDRLSELDSKLNLSLACRTHEFNAQAEYTDQSFKVRIPLLLLSFDLMVVLCPAISAHSRAPRIAVPTRSRTTTMSYSDVLTSSSSCIKTGNQLM